MVNYCCVYGCNSSSASGSTTSMFRFPVNKRLKKAWEMRIRRQNFTPNARSVVCSNHFLSEDYVQHKTKKILKPDAVPSVFLWNKKIPQRRDIRTVICAEDSSTESASEGEDDEICQQEASTQASQPAFGIHFLQNHKDKSLLHFYTGLRNYETFDKVLLTILPEKKRALLVKYHNRKKDSTIAGEDLLDEDISDLEYTSEKDPAAEPPTPKLSVDDEFLLVMMRLRVGLFYKDLATRFEVSTGSAYRIFYSWIQFMYFRLGSINCFPHRDAIIKAMPVDFKSKYPSTMLIIDCTEIRIETPSSLQLQSSTFSNYKSTNTLKCLLGVDPRGGIMFVSHLFTGSVSDKDLCQRSGLMDLLKHKVSNGELHSGDAVMADKGFLIVEEMKAIGMVPNQPPFLSKREHFTEHEVINTRSIARHRVHVERAIRKIRQFHIFDRRIPVSMLHMVNQIWTVFCMLSNFQPAIL